MNQLHLVCFDFETGGLDPLVNEAISVAGKAYNPRTLEPVPVSQGGEFYSLMKPLHFDRLTDKAMSVNKIPIDDLHKAPDQGTVWRSFVDWVGNFNQKKTKYGAPIPLGKNIRHFDLRFAEELNKKHCKKKEKTVLFNTRRQKDLEDYLFDWWENSNELEDEKMDTLRGYFGLPTEGAHNALVDVRQTGELIMKFMRLNRALRAMKNADGTPYLKFRNSLAKRAA